jgi:hypothetical protein
MAGLHVFISARLAVWQSASRSRTNAFACGLAVWKGRDFCPLSGGVSVRVFPHTASVH